MKSLNLYFIVVTAFFSSSYAQELKNPSFEEVISLQSVSNAQISPNGQHVVFQKQSTDWKNNRFDSELWLSKNGNTPLQLTNTKDKSSSNPKWSPDGNWIGFLANRDKNTQLFVINTNGGEAIQVSKTQGNISSFEWSPDGKTLAFIQSEDLSKTKKSVEDLYGSFAEDDKEYALNQLWTMPFNPSSLNQMYTPQQIKDSVFMKALDPKLHLEDANFSINTIKWSPDGSTLALEHQPDPLIMSFFKADISLYDISSETLTPFINNISYDGLIAWSPDGSAILYESDKENTTTNFYANNSIYKINLDGSNNVKLAKNFDENIDAIQWTNKTIYGLAWQKTKRILIKIDPNSGNTELLEIPSERIYNYSLSEDGSKMAYSAQNDTDLTEVYLTDLSSNSAKKLTKVSSQINNWLTAESDVISWKSNDGTLIEGVLHKPKNFDPNKKYPLMVIIHGGPTGISTPSPTPSYVYPMLQWLNKGALILRPNYRGSAGYGGKFRALNVRNLGVGDAWDVLSGVKYLESKGMINSDKVASMGWSQGGYISAFLTTNSNKFKAISVGAGISNWMTYYVNTDIHPFTRQYLKSTPWSDKMIYEKTSPMTNINNASTPTLIQHGEFDKRVPVANAYELYQGLQDVGVESKLIIYKGFGHGISKPKERLAAVWHNWQWFGKYIWDEVIELPKD